MASLLERGDVLQPDPSRLEARRLITMIAIAQQEQPLLASVDGAEAGMARLARALGRRG